jgi:DNA invertase Pin-like site-specific DNA recombinase
VSPLASDDEPTDEESGPQLFADEERDLLVKRLALCGLPTREIVRITAASGRTVARIIQRWGIRRPRPEHRAAPRMRRAQRLGEVLGEYYALNEITLDSLDRLSREHGLSVKELFDLIRENVSPSRWAIRSCLACGQSALTSSPSDRYCSACKSTVKKARGKMDEAALYE